MDENMSPEEFEALQASLIASMTQEDNINIQDNSSGEEDNNAGGGMLNSMLGMLGMGN